MRGPDVCGPPDGLGRLFQDLKVGVPLTLPQEPEAMQQLIKQVAHHRKNALVPKGLKMTWMVAIEWRPIVASYAKAWTARGAAALCLINDRDVGLNLTEGTRPHVTLPKDIGIAPQ